ncbi:uncharacterized protein B4U80_03850 [Leptotrombidium deliense]|uniref:Uncharacterized protein n=1 Tax=Leptotrombidium deliense TaxID=299467 RepID=A0A443SCD6_9ACAR|nr:uncharacterized protein B4U80_03850 [Leptotrombidium deliense]
MPIDLYYDPDSPGCRSVLMTAKYLNIPLNLKLVILAEGAHMNPSYEKLNPQKLVPTIVDDGFALSESRAIMQYLCNQYAPENDIYPKCPKKRAAVDRMLNFDIGSLYKSIWDWIGPQVMQKQPPNSELEKEFAKQLLILNDHFLKKQKYVAGDQLTIADFTILVSVTFLLVLNYDLSKYTNIISWLTRLENELPFWDEYITKGIISLSFSINDSQTFKYSVIKLWEGEHLKPEFEKLNPQKLVPTVVDDGFALGESRAIMQYLCNQYAPENAIYPKCPKKRAVVDRMLNFDFGLLKSIWDWMGPQGLERKPPNAELEKEFVKQLTVLNEHFLKNQKYVAANHLTIADFTILISVTLLYALDYDLSKYANIQSWLSQLEKEVPSWDEYVIKPAEKLKQLFQ